MRPFKYVLEDVLFSTELSVLIYDINIIENTLLSRIILLLCVTGRPTKRSRNPGIGGWTPSELEGAASARHDAQAHITAITIL